MTVPSEILMLTRLTLQVGSLQYPVECQWILGVAAHSTNPKGIEPFSPGLRGTSYPGWRIRRDPSPERVESVLQGSGIQPFQGWAAFHAWTQGSPSQNRANPETEQHKRWTAFRGLLKDSIPSGLKALCPCKDTLVSGIPLRTGRNAQVRL